MKLFVAFQVGSAASRTSAPVAPINSSAAVDVVPDAWDVVVVLISPNTELRSADALMKPENSKTLAAFATVSG